MIDVLVSAPGRDEMAEPIQAAVEATVIECGEEVAEISVALLGDVRMREMNRKHLGHDYPTDVISFGLWAAGEPVVGDIYIGVEQAGRQADENGITLMEECLRLAVHGSLHVLGWDHPEDSAERLESEMYRLQEAILEGLSARGIGS